MDLRSFWVQSSIEMTQEKKLRFWTFFGGFRVFVLIHDPASPNFYWNDSGKKSFFRGFLRVCGARLQKRCFVLIHDPASPKFYWNDSEKWVRFWRFFGFLYWFMIKRVQSSIEMTQENGSFLSFLWQKKRLRSTLGFGPTGMNKSGLKISKSILRWRTFSSEQEKSRFL